MSAIATPKTKPQRMVPMRALKDLATIVANFLAHQEYFERTRLLNARKVLKSWEGLLRRRIDLILETWNAAPKLFEEKPLEPPPTAAAVVTWLKAFAEKHVPFDGVNADSDLVRHFADEVRLIHQLIEIIESDGAAAEAGPC